MALVTFAIRSAPFIIFRKNEKIPKIVHYLGKALPAAVIAMLVVYALKDTGVLAFPYGIPELVSIAAIILIHVWKRNTLLSITAGTLLYILIVNLAVPLFCV